MPRPANPASASATERSRAFRARLAEQGDGATIRLSPAGRADAEALRHPREPIRATVERALREAVAERETTSSTRILKGIADDK